MTYRITTISKLVLAFLVALLLLGIVLGSDPQALASEDASLAISEAKAGLEQAFAAVFSAAESGADVSDLVIRLNEAQDLLLRANVSLAERNPENASTLARQCIDASAAIIRNATDLQNQTEKSRENEFVWLIGLSAVGLMSLLIAGVIGWRFVRRRSIERVLKMKPEKRSDA